MEGRRGDKKLTKRETHLKRETHSWNDSVTIRQSQHVKKPRGRGRKPHNPLSRVYDSSGPDARIRGSAAVVAEKYLNLARDAHSSGDRIATESYHQHAEHYLRIVAAAQAQMSTLPVQSSDQEHSGGEGVVSQSAENGGDEQNVAEGRPRHSRRRNGGRSQQSDGLREGNVSTNTHGNGGVMVNEDEAHTNDERGRVADVDSKSVVVAVASADTKTNSVDELEVATNGTLESKPDTDNA